MSKEEPVLHIRGKARLLPDNVCTDHIISSGRKRDAADIREATKHIFEDLDPPLLHPIESGDIIVAGSNFGCSSAMEIAVEVLKYAGVGAIIARSFARTYYRNAVNLGLPVFEIDVHGIYEADEICVDLKGSAGRISNLTRGFEVGLPSIPSFVLEVILAGGLSEYYRALGHLPAGRLR